MGRKTIKVVDNGRLSDELNYLTDAKIRFERGLQNLLSHDLPVTKEWLLKVTNEVELRDYLFAEMNRSFNGGYVPRETRNRIKMEYYRVAQECGKDLEICSSIVSNPNYIIEDKVGNLVFDEDASKKKIESECFIFLDAEKLEMGATLLRNLEKALREFNDESLRNNLPVPDLGLTFYNPYGGCGAVDWHWLIDTLRKRSNLTEEESLELAKSLYRFDCIVKNDEA